MRNNYDYIIGIDTGVKTGFAVWNSKNKKLDKVETTNIHRVILDIARSRANYIDMLIRIEDARLRKWVQGGREKLQGVGSVKRDAKIFEDMCKELGIDYELVPPKNNKTKLSAAAFKAITKWEGRTSEHSRDAAMLVFGYN